MNAKILLGLALASAGLAAAALNLDNRRDTRAAWSQANELLFPALAGSAERAARLRIESSDGVTTVERRGEQWVVVERGGYAGRADEVGRLLVGLAEAKRLEPKTKDPEKYEKLGLAGFAAEDSPTVRLTVEDEGGAVLADVLVGDRKKHGASEGWYVKEPDEAQTFSVDGKLRSPRRTSEWLDAELFDVARERIQEVSIEPLEGQPVHLVRPDPEASSFQLANAPEGRKPKSERSGASFLGSLAALRLSDVRPAAEASFPEPPPTTTTWRTNDGLVVTAELAEVGDADPKELLCRFHFALDEARLPQPEAGPEPAPAGDAQAGDAEAQGEPGEGGAEEPAEPEEAAPPKKTRADIESERDSLAKKTEGWVFVLPSWKKSSFLVGMEELLEPLPEPPPEEPAAGAGEGDAPGQGAEAGDGGAAGSDEGGGDR